MKKEGYSYFKKPWEKFLVLSISIWEFIELYTNFNDLRIVLSSDIFTPEKLYLYAMSQKFICLMNFTIALSTLLIFILGIFSKSKKTSLLFETVIILFIVISLSFGLLSWHKGIGAVPLWTLILISSFCILIYSFYKYLKEADS